MSCNIVLSSKQEYLQDDLQPNESRFLYWPRETSAAISIADNCEKKTQRRLRSSKPSTIYKMVVKRAHNKGTSRTLHEMKYHDKLSRHLWR